MPNPLKSVRQNWVVPPGLGLLLPLFPALKRWAKLVRPSGGWILLRNTKREFSRILLEPPTTKAKRRVAARLPPVWPFGLITYARLFGRRQGRCRRRAGLRFEQ